jgi:signal peptide peptidase SppA
MKLSEFLTSPCAIRPEQLAQIQDIYAAHVRGEVADLATIEARLGRPLSNEPKPYEVVRGVAVVPVHGVMTPKASMFSDVSGMVSTQTVIRMLRETEADPDVKAVIAHLDTPGGAVVGTPELGAELLRLRAVKPLVAFSDGQVCSAGYWAGSACAKLYISGPVVEVGSIGVVAMHRDFSKQEAASGVKTTEVTAGRYKRIASQYEPLTKAGREHMQERVDYLYSLFVDAVASHRGVSVEQVLSDMADGRVFIGQQAIDAGLVDGFMSLDQLIDQLATDPQGLLVEPPGSRPGGRSRAATATIHPTTTGASAPVVIPERTTTMSTPENTQPTQAAISAAVTAAVAGLTAETLASGNPGLYAALQAQFSAEGAKAERERIQAVRGQALPGHEALIEQLAFDGKTTGPEAAAAVVQAHRATLATAGQAHYSDAPAAAPGGAAGAAAAAGGAKTREQMDAEAKAYAKQHNVDYVAALQALGYDKV